MKKMLLAVAAVMMLLFPFSAEAQEGPEPDRHYKAHRRPHRRPHRPRRPRPRHPKLYKCQASSNYAWGIGYGRSRRSAAEMALYRCARSTPRYDACLLDWCRRIR